MALRKEAELSHVIQRLIDEGRRTLGDPPSPKQLEAYHTGCLGHSERDRIAELLAHYPESVVMLLDLISYPGESGELSYLNDEVFRQDWLTIQKRLRSSERASSYLRPNSEL